MKPDKLAFNGKADLLKFDRSAHLTLRELVAKKVLPDTRSAALRTRLETLARDAAAAQLAGGSEQLRAILDQVELPKGVDAKARLHDVMLATARERIAADPKLRDNAALKEAVEKAAEPAASKGGAMPHAPAAASPTIADALSLDLPIFAHPAFRPELNAARLYRIGDAARLDDKVTKTLIAKVGDVAAVSDQRLATLVKDGTLDQQQAQSVASAVSIYRVLDERPELMEHVAAGVGDVRALVKLDAAAWRKAVTESGALPPGIAPNAYAELLERKVARLFPSEAIAARLATTDVPRAVAAGGDAARRVVNLYPGLRLDELFADAKMPAAKIEAEAVRRVDLVHRFLAENTDALALDLTIDSRELGALKLPADKADQQRVLATARAFQRAHAVVPDPADVVAVVAGGFPGAVALAAATPEIIATRTGLAAEKAAQVWTDAQEIAMGVTARIGSIVDLVKGGFKDTGVGNVPPSIDDYLKRIPGFSDFFGDQDYCACCHCQSILSPAAYFVDLMRFIDERVTQPFFAAKPQHELNLKTRRPDLWKVEFTCAHTNTPIPHLVIIDEILENAVAAKTGFAGDYGDRPLVERTVYRDTLPDQVDSFAQPLHLAFTELSVWLQHFEVTLADVGEAAGATGDTLARLRLGLAPRDAQLITTVGDALPALRRIYGFQFVENANVVDKFDVQEIVRRTGVSRDDLGDLVSTRYVTANGGVAIQIVAEKLTAESVQNDVERIQGLTRAALDRLHRFVRLWRAVGWRVGELDLALVHAQQAGLGTGLDATALQTVARTLRLQERLGGSVEELLGLWSLIPNRAVLREVPEICQSVDDSGAYAFPPAASPLAYLATSLFDQLFNPASLVASGGAWPQDATLLLHPALAAAPLAAPDPNLHRLRAGLGVDEDELYQLIVGLAVPLGVHRSSANDADRRFALSHRNLTLLYRHARLAKLLGVSIPEVFALAALAPGVALAYVETFDELDAVMAFNTWRTGTSRSLSELIGIVRPGLPAVMTSTAAVAGTAAGAAVTYTAKFVGQVQAAETVTFHANATLDAVVADWNAQAASTEAFRSDANGVPSTAGTRLSIRTRGAAGASTRIDLAADPTAMFAAALPSSRSGADLPDPAGATVATTPADAAQQLVTDVATANALLFADTVFALLSPVPPAFVSAVAVAGTVGGETVTFTASPHGHAAAAETVVFAANASLDAAIADWNAKSRTTRAFRSDAAGYAAAAGDRLAIRVAGAGGSDTTLAITADATGFFTAALPSTSTGAEISEDQSRGIVAANVGRLEPVGSEGRFRLAAAFDPSVPLALPAGVPASLEPLLRDILRNYHSERTLLARLPGRTGVAPSLVAGLLALLGESLGTATYFAELLGTTTPPVRIALLIERLQRLGLLFTDTAIFTDARLAFVRDNAALFGIANFDRIPIAGVRHIELFRSLLAVPMDASTAPPDLEGTLVAFDPVAHFGPADQAELARVFGCDAAILQSVAGHAALSTTPFEVLDELRRGIALVTTLGGAGAILELARSAAYDDLAAGSAAVQAAFRAKYDDEQKWTKAMEPFRDRLLERRRDGLVAYMIHSSGRPFKSATDLYYYYLVDVQLSGCARTSRVAAAIDAAQLYVHRCLMNLEESPEGAANPVHVLPQSIPAGEWEWRENHSAWEANRKIAFLQPENYLDPGFRDDKTPLFRELESDLLSKDITEESILDAYSRYLRGFDEVARLNIAGSYHEKDLSAQRDVLHLFGVTADDPPTVYYRRVENAHFGVANDARPTNWGVWEKLDIQVPVRKVAPIVHNGQLYVFWIRYITKSLNAVEGGDSKFIGYQHRAYIEFSKRRLDGGWTAPQKLRLTESPFTARGDGVILDPITPKGETDLDLVFFQIKLYSDYQPLYDNIPHDVPKDDYSLKGFMWDRVYPASGDEMSIRAANFQLWSPVDLYQLAIGPRYEYEDPGAERVPWLNPAIFVIIWALSGGDFDLTRLLPPRLVWSRLGANTRTLFRTPSGLPCFDTYTYAALLLDEARITHFQVPLAVQGPPEWRRSQWAPLVTDTLLAALSENRIADVPPDVALDVVNGSVGDVMLQTSSDAFYLQEGARADGKYHIRRLGSSVSGDIADILFNKGLDTLLATSTQLQLKEHPTNLSLDGNEIFDATETGTLDYHGATGVYLREIFCHIPHLIANYFNSQGKFEDAQRWYQRIFDPFASETITGIDPALPPEERHRRELDRNWRYREFRGLTAETLREELTNAAEIDAYKANPFNPYAVARLRLSAYQRAIVMGFIDNLLDWGDDLFARAFAQLNPEYLRQATLKYVTALDILGERPARIGDCGEGKVTPKNYETIINQLPANSEFLMEVESITVVRGRRALPKGALMVGASAEYATIRIAADAIASAPAAHAAAAAAAEPVVARVGDRAVAQEVALARKAQSRPTPTLIARLQAGLSAETRAAAARVTPADLILRGAAGTKAKVGSTSITPPDISVGMRRPPIKRPHGFGGSIVRQIGPVFCIPENDKLLGYWDRANDRLYKLRNCLDPNGVPRQLPLFAPVLDTELLAHGAAAGLSLDELLGVGGGDVPPYRFPYIIEKAKSYAATLQGLGGALLAALERKDTEELARLRNVQQRNVLALTTELRQNELKIAQEGVTMATLRQAAAQYRFDYYNDLVSKGLTASEITQDAARITASVLRTTAAITDTIAAIAHLIPDVGSPFAMKYGGLEVGMSATSWSMVMNRVADAADTTATIAGVVAGYERRDQGWVHQQQLAKHDLKAISRELVAAGFRQAIAERALKIHETTKDQQDEIMDLYDAKFTNLALYTYLARSLQQLHRDAYGNALAMAKLAERAYRFERPNDDTAFIGGEWDASRSGLHSGERLSLGLQRMERRYLETNDRAQELNQSFSLAQIDPEALVKLKESGTCEFAIPELYFDLFYPGEFRRRMRGVRLTVPCITGPYTNVGAKLTLIRSSIRNEPVLGPTKLLAVPPGRTASVTTSTAQGDAGVFEFSFRDDRYMPFEGAGAVSAWRLELPDNFRPFDYQTITDVMVNISYTADDDPVLRQQVETRAAGIQGSLLQALSTTPLIRVVSLRQEFSGAFTRLMTSSAGTPVTFDITDRHFPLFLRGRTLNATAGKLVLVVDGASPVAGVAFKVNDIPVNAFANPANPRAMASPYGGLPVKSTGGAFGAGIKKQHTIVATNAGALAAAGNAALFDPDKLKDLLVVIEYRL